MMKSTVPFSALYHPSLYSSHQRSTRTEASRGKGQGQDQPPVPLVQHWTPESDPNHPDADPSTHFDTASGEYTVPVDGIYLVIVQIIPINGGALVAQSSRRRSHVDFVLRLMLPHDRYAAPDAIQSQYMDIGSVNFGQMLHLKQHTRIAVLQMPNGAVGRDCVRLKVDIAQRKHKRHKPEFTRKQIKKRRKEKRRSESQSVALRLHMKQQLKDSTSSTSIPTPTNDYPNRPGVAPSSSAVTAASSSASLVEVNPFQQVDFNDASTSSSDSSSRAGGAGSSSNMHFSKNHNATGGDDKKRGPVNNDNNDDDDDDDDDDDWSSDDSDWEAGFESDSTADELSHSGKNINRLAKRFKASTDSEFVFN